MLCLEASSSLPLSVIAKYIVVCASFPRVHQLEIGPAKLYGARLVDSQLWDCDEGFFIATFTHGS